METQSLRSEILLELISCAEHKEREDEIIDEVLHTYMQKLNCFMVGILKNNDTELIEKQLLPASFENDTIWPFLKEYINNAKHQCKKEFCEVVHTKQYYYIYQLTNYGYLVLGKESSFDTVFQNEFRLVVNLLNKILLQSIEDERRKQVDKKLADERRLLRTIIDNIPINIYAKDLQFRKTLANVSEIKFLGKKTESEVIGKTDFELYGESIGKNVQLEDEKVLIDGEPILAEERYITNDRWALVSKLPIKEEDGSITGMVGISVDYTEQKKSQNQTLLFLKLLDNSSDAVQVTLETGELFYINKTASERLGIDPKDVQNYKVTDYISTFKTLDDWKKHVEELKTCNFISSEGINVNQKTGEQFPVEVQEKYVDVNGVGYIMANSRDITERKLAEDELLKSELKYRTITENISDVVWTSDLQFNMTFMSPSIEKMVGEPLELYLKWPISKKFTKKSLDKIQYLFSLELEKEKDPRFEKNRIIKLEVEHYRADQTTFWAEMSISILRDENDIAIGIQGVMRDISQRKKAEIELRKSEERKASLIASMSDIVFVLDNDLIMIESHMPLGSTQIIDPEPYLGNPFDAIPIPSHAKVLIKNSLVSCITNHVSNRVEYYLDMPYGRKWFELHATVLNDQYGEQSGVTAVIRDITVNKQAEETIRQQLKMQDILIRISTIYININLDKVKEVIQDSLKELAEFVGADRAYIFDYDFTDNTTSNTHEWCSEGIIPEIDQLQKMPLDDLPYFYGKHKQGEELCINDVNELVENGKGSLKEGLEMQGIKSLISIPMMTSGKLIGFVGFDSIKQKHIYTDKEKNLLEVFSQMLVNITERKRSESFLMLQEEKYRNIISNMNLGIIEVDKDENILYANQSFSNISGYSIDELLSMKTDTFFISPEQSNILADKLKVREKGISDSYELVVKNKKGEQRWWFVSGAPNYDDNNELKGSIGIHLDITEQKLLEKELEKALIKAEQATKAQEMFLANMSHEIRTPLNVIIGMVRELNKEKLNDRQRGFLKHSETSTLHLLTIVNNILDMSKIQAGEFELDLREFSIASVAADVNSILHSRATDKRLDFRLNISKELKPALIGDPGRLRQILINLLGNAIKFTDAGHVELNVTVLNTTNDNQQVLFEVIDSGIGISDDFLHKLFDKFTQEESSSNRRYEGSGLGMSITKELVQLMGGNIEAKSKKGLGTQIRFELNLPVGDETKLAVQTIKISKNSFEGIKILLVEDNEMNRFIALQSLKITGCQITEATNGLEAIEKLKEDAFDIILMDIQMPKMNGVEATEFIRLELNKEIPIIALTANAFKNDIDLYLSIGMTDYLIKPYKEEDLYRVVDKYVRKPKTKAKLYDVEQLLQISRGDTVFVKNMLDVFKKMANETITQLNESFKNSDLEAIHKIAHKIKPSIDNLKIVKITEPIRELEKFNLAVHSESDLESLIADVTEVLELIITDIDHS